MNTINIIIYATLFWVIFSQLYELRNANDGCCSNKSCGKSEFDEFLYNGSLLLSSFFTFLFLYRLLELYMGSDMRARNFRANPAKSLANEGTELLFGR